MGEVSTIGLDIAKSVFQVHGVDGAGAVVMRKRISRAKMLEFFAALPRCLVGMEACPSAHHWGRELQALGHTVRLMPPELCEGLSQAQQERCERCGCDLRGSGAAIDAVCSNQDERAAGWLDASPNPAIAGASAHDVEQRPARALGGTGHRVGEGTPWHQSIAWHHHGRNR